MFNTNTQETIILSVGGSLIVPNGGLDISFLSKFNQFIRKHVKKNRKFFIVCGGGRTSRQYRDAGAAVIGKITNEDLDWLGIHATRLNAHLMRTIFQDIAHPRIIENYNRKLFNAREPVVIAAGWKPGWSTDYDAVILARDYKASVIINLSNIDYLYDKDPAKFKDAKPIKKVTWDYFVDITEQEWRPGIHSPFDPVASQLAQKLGITVIIANGKRFKNLDNILNGESFNGTVITPFKIDASYYDRVYYDEIKKEVLLKFTTPTIANLIRKIISKYRALYLYYLFRPRNALDIGCGTGTLVKDLRKLGVEAYGIEISPNALQFADKDIRPYLQLGDITQIPYKDDSFDLVISYDVIEHLERSKLKKAFLESVRVSRKWIFHKVYTTENLYMRLFHKKDFSLLSILSSKYWVNLIKYIGNVTVVKKNIFRLPSFFETIIILRKKTE